MQLPDLNLLIALDALLDEGSVVGAARRMHLSPAAMSRTLTRIREATGDPVLVRAGRGLVPTPRALAMQAQVRELVEQAAQVFQARDEVDMSTLERCFNVRSNDVFFGSFGARVLEAIRVGAPGCTLRFVPEGADDDDALREGRIDLYISSRLNFGPEIKIQNLFNTRFCGLAREGHPIFDGPITPERFAGFDHVSVSRRGRARGPIDPALAELGLERRIALITPHFHSAIFGVAESDLILSLPEPVLWGLKQLGLKMRAFAIPLALETVSVNQAWHPRFDKDPAHRWLRQTLKEVCSVPRQMDL
ncbi:LysR family transcriptional regulator [Pseudomonas viridiflava]|uniref:LysR family transcriptional regulator n=3 Tax=Pseudomonas TaxID=286 RepID=A0ABU7NBL1_PSEVI|nr:MULTISPECIES: LysR family transcriptional regulator [Pseudomonas]MBI6577713.1 LysR family transcriptional regulator [Pseudomonas viridiflava]MBI6606694.1 LysR family transcriptional regulator [Pseudomonas viridiflava]MBI6638421.1 LysR family transcriptional regulator [Pseudomonas viridiflava]MBI6869920.1 LysR family transcriptional regulator [Pseudomonas viridiflava]MBP0944519.1 LysR family transcriptional regulator [Pseudomonas alliivorans]